MGRKFKTEGRSRRYTAIGIRSPAGLARSFADPGKLRDLHENWERLLGTEFLFLPGERSKSPAETLTDPHNVQRICLEFWQPTLDLLTRI